MIIEDDNKNEIFGGEADTTNNRMEILAVIMALKAINTISLIFKTRFFC